jgi:hypothetical protein
MIDVQQGVRVGRSLLLAAAAAAAGTALLTPFTVSASERTLPMHFQLRVEGPADSCGTKCKVFISAMGAITADTPRDFHAFAQGRTLNGATVVLDSDGGSVHGAITLGREIRHLGLNTTVGTVVDLKSTARGEPARGTFSPRADCESMCAFVLLAGVHRTVSPEARVMVHQIWLGDRRDDPTAANYSAEDLVLVQRDIGRLARYTADMGTSMDMLDLSLRIPPWEPMHAMTPDELRVMHVATDEAGGPVAAATVAASAPATTPVAAHPTTGVNATEISERRWSLVAHSGGTALARRQPLTVEGEDIGTFDLMVSCGATRGTYNVSYVERRHGADKRPLPAELASVLVKANGQEAALKIVSSEHRSQPGELVTYASGPVPATLIDAFGTIGNHSLSIRTKSAGEVTGIRLGNTGVLQALPQLAASCTAAAIRPLGERADLTAHKTGGIAAAGQ